jgi:hypothetical protein
MTDWVDPVTGFRRTSVERGGPPYIGRGLLEAIPNDDIAALEDPDDNRGTSAPETGCSGDCITGRRNMNTAANISPFGFTTPHLGRFGLRGQGPQLVAFIAVGSQEETGITNRVRPAENIGPPQCTDGVPDPDTCLDNIFSTRSLIRMTAPPEFGDTLLGLLNQTDPHDHRAGGNAKSVQRGAALFGVDLRAFANRMIPGRMPSGGDGLDLHAISNSSSSLMCATCHTPVQRTGQSPADVGAEHLSNKWAPIFSDVLLHSMPYVEAERNAPTARLPLFIPDQGFDIPRNLGEDALPSQGIGTRGTEWRTPPLMGIGRIGPPFYHDVRVYLSQNTVGSFPARTVRAFVHSHNVPLIVHSADDALAAAIELHDLPAPRPGCPVPPADSQGIVRVGDVVYGDVAAATQAICPPLDAENRGEAREVMRRWHNLTPADQQAVIDFLKEL